MSTTARNLLLSLAAVPAVIALSTGSTLADDHGHHGGHHEGGDDHGHHAPGHH